MAATAAYVAIQDGATVLDHAGDIDHSFARFDAAECERQPAPDPELPAQPHVGEGDVTLEMTLNEIVIVEQTFTSNEARRGRRSSRRTSCAPRTTS